MLDSLINKKAHLERQIENCECTLNSINRILNLHSDFEVTSSTMNYDQFHKILNMEV